MPACLCTKPGRLVPLPVITVSCTQHAQPRYLRDSICPRSALQSKSMLAALCLIFFPFSLFTSCSRCSMSKFSPNLFSGHVPDEEHGALCARQLALIYAPPLRPCHPLTSTPSDVAFYPASPPRPFHICRLSFADTFEKFLQNKYNTVKRFGLNGMRAIFF